MTSAQITSNLNNELQEIVFDKKNVLGFINEKFNPYSTFNWEDRFEQLQENNPIYEFDISYKVNRAPILKWDNYTIFGLPVSKSLCAYLAADDKFALYFSVYFDKTTFEKIFGLIGKPENLDPGEKSFLLENYAMFFWPLESMDMIISKLEFGPFKGLWKVAIYNMEYKKLFRPELSLE